MPDNVWWWVGAGVVALTVGGVAGYLEYGRGFVQGTGEGYTNGYVEGLNAGVEQGKAVERERQVNIAAATEADRKAAIKLNRSRGAKNGWARRKGEA